MLLAWVKEWSSFATKSLDNPYGIPLDLSYISDELLCCSFPTARFPSKYYRNDIKDLVDYLDLHHGDQWKIFSLRTQHKDEYNVSSDYLKGKFANFPWQDHEGPPFPYLIRVLDAIDNFVNEAEGNVAIIHCRMGKGRSGLIAASYLMYKKGMTKLDAENEFTNKRMTWGFGEGISIKSQMKYCEYMRIHCESPDMFYTHAFIPNIKIRFLGARFKSHHEHVKIMVSGYDSDEANIEPVLLRETLEDKAKGIVETLVPNSERFTDLRVSLTMNNFLNLKVTTVYLWFNIFFELKTADDSKIARFTWEDFDGLKGTGKKGFRLFDKMELHF